MPFRHLRLQNDMLSYSDDEVIRHPLRYVAHKSTQSDSNAAQILVGNEFSLGTTARNREYYNNNSTTRKDVNTSAISPQPAISLNSVKPKVALVIHILQAFSLVMGKFMAVYFSKDNMVVFTPLLLLHGDLPSN